MSGEIRNHSDNYYHAGKDRYRDLHSIFKFTLRGEGAFRDANGEHRTPAGHGFLVRISDPDTSYYYPEDGTEDWEFIYTSFSGADSIVNELTSLYGPVFKLSLEDPAIQNMISHSSMMRDTVEVTASEGARMVQTLLLSLASSKEQVIRKEPGNMLVRTAFRVIEQNMDKNINAEDVARVLNISREHLTRVFKIETGTSPYRYIQRRKMLYACRLLKNCPLSNKEISAKLGYDSPAHFTRTFKNFIKMTPSAFRKIGIIPVN